MSDIRVISLRSSEVRRQQFAQRNAHLPFHFVDALDGARLPVEVLGDRRLFEPGLAYSRGASGCALSHRQLWQEAVRLQVPLTIAEDDAVFRHDFAQVRARVMQRLPVDWDFVLWGWNFDAALSVEALPGVSAVTMLFDQSRMRENIDRFQAEALDAVVLKLGTCFGIPAYTISAAGAARFLDLCFPLRNKSVRFPLMDKPFPNVGPDVAMSAVYGSTNSYIIFPPLVVTPNVRSWEATQQRGIN